MNGKFIVALCEEGRSAITLMYVSFAAQGVICGLGATGYALAVQAIASNL